jgi:hypothetical protein
MFSSEARRLAARLERDGGPGRLRPFRPDDIPAIVALRRRAFRFGQRSTPGTLAAYCEEIFCRNPWADPDLPSLVYENESGALAGFLGVIPRPMWYRGAPIRAAVATQLMVAPESRGLAGLRLARAFIEGPQDLSLSDTANDVARRLWRSVGGFDSPLHGMTWVVPLRPLYHAAVRWAGAGGLTRRVVARAARPILVGTDAVMARRPGGIARRHPTGHVAPFDAAAVVDHVNRAAWGRSLRPRYEDDAFRWLLARAAEKAEFGALRSAMVVETGGDVMGWCIWYARAGAVAEAVAVSARPGAEGAVFQHLRQEVWRDGARALAGRCDMPVLHQVDACGGRVRSRGPWLLYHAKRPEIAHDLVRGDAQVSRLDGEWWLSF